MNTKKILSILAILFLIGTATATETSPFFISEINESDNGLFTEGLLIPAHLQNSNYAVVNTESTVLPAKFDWRILDGVTPIKDQGKCGSCFAFATVKGVETNLKIETGQIYDLSEEQAKNCLFQFGGCTGGTVLWVINKFTSNGVITEADFTYSPTNGLCRDIEPTFRVTDWSLLSTETPLDTDSLKQYIMQGPVISSIVVEGWNKTYNGSYVLNPPPEPDIEADKRHAVVLVGWNDSLSDKNVSGHFIFANSWGTEWGDDGYGKLEYNSANVGTHASLITGVEMYDSTIRTVTYDDAGWGQSIGAHGFDQIQSMSIFNLTEDIVGVEFWTTGKTSDIDIYLYDAVEMPNGYKSACTYGNELYRVENLAFNEPGYKSVSIRPVNSTTGTIVVIVNIKNVDCVHFDDKVAPIAVDFEGPVESLKTYISVGDSTNSWYNCWYPLHELKLLDGRILGVDSTIRLRVKGEPVSSCEYILIETEGYVRRALVGSTIDFTVKCVDEYGGYVDCTDITWNVSNTTVCNMSGSTFTALHAGNVTIHAIGECGYSSSNGINITVTEPAKDYLTDEVLQGRIDELVESLDELEANNTQELQSILDLLDGIDTNNTIIRISQDSVSIETFNDAIDTLEQKIESMRATSTSIFERIYNKIMELIK